MMIEEFYAAIYMYLLRYYDILKKEKKKEKPYTNELKIAKKIFAFGKKMKTLDFNI